jgi:LmbE family N-acetylglucosaminyl deacetylase
LRRSEAIAACRILGVPEGRVSFLGFPDGELIADVAGASRSVADVLERTRPAQVFVPHRKDALGDHNATYEAVALARPLLGFAPELVEYAIWLWDQWPWTNPLAPPRGRRGRRQVLRGMVDSTFGLSMSRLLNTRIDVSDALEMKTRALAEHRTQMTRYDDRPEWITLADIDHGAWLSHFALPFEFFRMSDTSPLDLRR